MSPVLAEMLLSPLDFVGWGTAEMVMTKVLPLWVGARGVEFEWTNIQAALESNLNLVSE